MKAEILNLSRMKFLKVLGTQYCGDLGFLLGFHRDVERLCIETELKYLCDIFFQHHIDVVALI